MEALIFVCQAIDLVFCILWHALAAILAVPWFLLVSFTSSLAGSRRGTQAEDEGCTFYEGIVTHERRAPAVNRFRYPVRVALFELDKAPRWFDGREHLAAQEARAYAGTNGKVLLLTNPVTAGYTQNPISVYYCYGTSSQGDPPSASSVASPPSSSSETQKSQHQGWKLEKCIIEVTNTPWNEGVTFVIPATPSGSLPPSSATPVGKSLHVSPFMDMAGTWLIQAPEPTLNQLRLVVKVAHPEYGPDLFHADLVAKRSKRPHVRSEMGGLPLMWRYGFQPHWTALRIYWQAMILISKGLPLYGLPSLETKLAGAAAYAPPAAAPAAAAAAAGATGKAPYPSPRREKGVEGRGGRAEHFTWRAPSRWPWNVGAQTPNPEHDGGSRGADDKREGDTSNPTMMASARSGSGCPFSGFMAGKGGGTCPVAGSIGNSGGGLQPLKSKAG